MKDYHKGSMSITGQVQDEWTKKEMVKKPQKAKKTKVAELATIMQKIEVEIKKTKNP